MGSEPGPGSSSGPPADAPSMEVPSKLAAQLSGRHWDARCMAAIGAALCTTTNSVAVITLDGPADHRYRFEMRIRGVVEPVEYDDGRAITGGWYAGGFRKAASDASEFSLTVENALDEWYYLNHRVGPTDHVIAVDYQVTLELAGNAELALVLDTDDDEQLQNLDGNGAPINVPGVTTTPYDGQFIQLDVLSVTPIP